jgi:hypothetical protein
MGRSDDYYGQTGRMRLDVRKHQPAADTGRQVPCDRCHTASAKVELITAAGSVFLCQHHHREHGAAIIAAGYQIRAR